jgi:hypothetical protein
MTMSGPISGSASTVSTDQKGNLGSDNKGDGKVPTVQVKTTETPVTSGSPKDDKVRTVQVDTIETPVTSGSSKDGQAPSVQVDTQPPSSDQSNADTPSQQANFDELLAAALARQAQNPNPIDSDFLEAYQRQYGTRSGIEDIAALQRAAAIQRGGYGLANYRSDPAESSADDWSAIAGQRGANRHQQSASKKPAYVIGPQAGKGAINAGQGYVIPGQKPQ